jgi:histidyl-tRNA synthetase
MQPLTGFRDFYPEDYAIRHHVFSTWRVVAARYGFVEYDGPPLEPLELYTKKSGDEIVGQLYNFIDKGERAVTLRAEMTPTFARMVAVRHREFRKPMKWFSIPQVFRYERPQKGRLREHFQFNADIVGESGTGADAEIIALLIDVLRALGLTAQDVVIRLSDRQFWIDFLKANDVPEARWYEVFQAIDKAEREPREKTAEKLGSLAEKVFQILDHGSTNERLDTIKADLTARGLGDFVKIDLSIVRGLAYYTGVVFEAFDRSGQFRAIAGGGRYDDLIQKVSATKFDDAGKPLDGIELASIGFGLGDVVLGEMLKAKQLLPAKYTASDVFIVVADEGFRKQALALLQDLRTAGLRVDLSLAPAKMGKQFELAEERGATKAVVVDGKIASGVVAVKNLATREQSDEMIGDLIAKLK